MIFPRSLTSRAAVMLLAVIAAGVYGCGGDDKPTQPSNQTSEFDEATARAQAQSAGPQAVSLVQSMTVMAQGFSSPSSLTPNDISNYGWDEAEGRWEWEYTWSQDGSEGEWFYTVQYLDAAGRPQQGPLGALTIRHTMTGTSSYHHASGGTVSDGNYLYAYDTTITGLGTGALLMTGSGNWDYDFTYTSGGQTYDYDYEVTWQILDPGITLPAGGCPTGTVRYEFDPYRLDVVFNGTGTVTGKLYHRDGSPVSSGSYTYNYPCN